MRLAIPLSLLAVIALAAPQARAEEMSGNTQFLLGQRSLRDENWGHVDSPTIFGVEIDFAPSTSPIHVALGIHVGGESGTGTPLKPVFGDTGDVKTRFFEFSTGFLWHPVRKAIVRPYLGGGACLIAAANGADWGLFSSGNDGDQSFGWYGNAGIFFKVGEHFNIGVDGRMVRGTKITFGSVQGNADYEQVAMLLGFSWGAPPSAPHHESEPHHEPEAQH